MSLSLFTNRFSRHFQKCYYTAYKLYTPGAIVFVQMWASLLSIMASIHERLSYSISQRHRFRIASISRRYSHVRFPLYIHIVCIYLCVCVALCFCVYVCDFTCVFVFLMYVFRCVFALFSSVCRGVFFNVCVLMCVFGFLSVSLYVSLCLRLLLYVCVCVCVFLSLCFYVCVFMRVFLCVSVFNVVSTDMFVHMCLFLCLHWLYL